MPRKDYRDRNLRKCKMSSNAWKKAHPEQQRAHYKHWIEKNGGREYVEDYHLLNKNGITAKEKRALLESQGGVCLICSRIPKIAHTDHEVGFIRGILCSSCNPALGKFQDDPALLRRAADYLEGKLAPFIPIKKRKQT